MPCILFWACKPRKVIGILPGQVSLCLGGEGPPERSGAWGLQCVLGGLNVGELRRVGGCACPGTQGCVHFSNVWNRNAGGATRTLRSRPSHRMSPRARQGTTHFAWYCWAHAEWVRSGADSSARLLCPCLSLRRPPLCAFSHTVLPNRSLPRPRSGPGLTAQRIRLSWMCPPCTLPRQTRKVFFTYKIFLRVFFLFL